MHGRPTAKIDPSIARVDLPGSFVLQFKTGCLTTAAWTDLFIDAKHHVEGDDSEEEEPNSAGGKDNMETNDLDEDKGSRLLSGFDEGDYNNFQEINIKWDCDLHELGGGADWAHTAKAHRATLDLLS